MRFQRAAGENMSALDKVPGPPDLVLEPSGTDEYLSVRVQPEIARISRCTTRERQPNLNQAVHAGPSMTVLDEVIVWQPQVHITDDEIILIGFVEGGPSIVNGQAMPDPTRGPAVFGRLGEPFTRMRWTLT